MSEFAHRLASALEERRQQHLYRERLVLESSQGPQVRLAGREMLNFCSNDYLGLAAHPKVIEALRRGAEEYGAGSGASHLVCGHSRPHHTLEEALAEFTGRPRALLFGSGFAANTAALSVLLQAGDTVLQDRLNHASLLDGGLHSGARLSRFPHNDVEALERKLNAVSGPSMVVVDGVFSMDGDVAPLAQLAALTRRHDAWLMVDDAHGFGVLGQRGAGSLEAAGLDCEDVPVLMATLGKALGCSGAFVAGSEVLVESLVQFARNYVYSTAMPPALAVAGLAALNLLSEEGWRRAYLQNLIARFRRGAGQLGLPLADVGGPIQPLLIGAADEALALSQALRERGLLVGAIRPPTVPAGTARLRITLTASHTEAQVDQLLDALDNAGAARHAA
ncbi:8-amino-7-oxononanoate synthase [Parahaliea maris]|uniref:8-amino-7-oxononanoate synthase n=1 Tax=Parahaliea maris TaxID=2716870 RepID=A0A5C8ZQD7_9GAMM|nr:8-amino-7-oxononanoate synthase [Parahaliea maris]TXS90703.1 8-amino-7-oxononanoate synthase [Parahaliea maris]